MSATDITDREFPVQVGPRQITARLLSPPAERLAANPGLLLSLGSDRHTGLTVHPYNINPLRFLAQGHRVVVFDLPNHGERVNAYGQGIAGFRNAWAAGDDPFATLVDDGRAVIDACIGMGVGAAGRIVVEGTSRGGYCALRLLAADARLLAGAAHAPVTDWRFLSEFAADAGRADVARLALTHFVGGLVGKPVHIAIGHHDDRVSTASCCRFFVALTEANDAAGHGHDHLDFFCTDDAGHGLGDGWRQRGGEFLLRRLQADG